MQEALPDLIYVPTHDPFSYTFDLVQPFLANGRLSKGERRALRDYSDRTHPGSESGR